MKRTAAAALLLVCLLAAAGAVSAQDSVAPQNFVPPPTTSATRFVATLRGNSAASAVMSLTVDTVAQTASYTFNMNNIPRYTMSHIHVGAAGVAGGVVVLLLPGLGTGSNVIAGGAGLPTIPPIDICTMTYTSIFAAADLIQFGTPTVPFTWDNFITNLRAGTLYVNIHTTDAPTGLIRGQLLSARGGIRTATFGGGFLFPGRCGLSPWWRP